MDTPFLTEDQTDTLTTLANDAVSTLEDTLRLTEHQRIFLVDSMVLFLETQANAGLLTVPA
jgi:hypothetical protein